MRARHVTSEKDYRDPFGAAQLGGTVTISIDVWGEDVVFCTLRIWTDAHGEELLEMKGATLGDRTRFSATYTPTETGIVWYSFDIESTDGSVWRYGAREGWTSGEGAFAYGDPPSFQITVYKPRENQPMWYRNGVAYQIFPDRFARGADWRTRVEASLGKPRKGPARALVEDWDTPPVYKRTDNGRIAEWDFYGGTLEGIVEHLDYLESLGVTVLYLNPIFEAVSNHRYDTADYLAIDPMLGDEKEFRRLCSECAKHGISIILDGVFNHAGCDSRYFNKYGNYPDIGAAQGPDSPYANWFECKDDGTYAAWWGVDDLPDLNENDPAFREFICGENGVVRTWLRAGARGWRLDVADELSDGFIAQIKEAVLAEKPDALLIGEVWEDASNKVSYGKLRQYFEGKELDGVMNYPLRTALLDFICNRIGATELTDRLEQLGENYPRNAFYSLLNLLGSHDRERLFTVLGGAPDPDTLSEDQRASYRLNEGQRGLAKSRLWLMALLQMTLPGVPCVYYGDERGLEGFRDPYNRATFPWDGGDLDCTTIYRNAIAVRKTLPVLLNGSFEPFAAGEDVFGFWRKEDGECVCVLVNGSLEHARTVKVPMVKSRVDDVISGRAPKVEHGQADVFLWPLGSAVLYFHETPLLEKSLERGMGVLAHITSLPNGMRPGTLGEPARRFVDWLAECGQTYWQVLPVNPTDEYGSPYAGLSAFAGNVSLLGDDPETVLARSVSLGDESGYVCFCRDNAEWLTPYALFQSIKDLYDGAPWQSWPEKYRTYSVTLAKDPKVAPGFEKHRRLQFEFDREWRELRAYANERGIRIIGDMPMYVSVDSSDVWAERDIFDLDAKGHARRQAGAPADQFSPEGQLWGNPTYRWDILRKQGYDWWLRRLERAFDIYDYVRLDHFIGFSSYYSIEAGKSARDGRYSFGPAGDLFKAAYDKFGPLPLIAEDLGVVTPAVRALISLTGVPGMDVVQFFDGDPSEKYEPKPGTIVYTGTHDNQTLVGWCTSRYNPDDPEALADEIAARTLGTKNDVAIMPLQDVLRLDDTARMNVPGVAKGNWTWQANADDVRDATEHLIGLALDSSRFRS